MTPETAVEFATPSRIHLGLAVQELERSKAFYRLLFGQEPTKVRPGYAKFEVAEPPVNLALNEVGAGIPQSHPVSHLGIQVKSTAAVQAVADRLTASAIPIKTEDHVMCCYAVQNKIWATDPDGNRWEVYVVLDNNGSQHHSSGGGCCPEMTEVKDALSRGDLAAARSALHMPAAACCSPAASAS